ncbi:dolichyl pyrophosphate Man9GlcNAc2 alpha-1,3-glucosyltransferase isoform X1 [Harpegnathos saltator]|uniref:Alpha-1,3-glucosyltransferase n=1 Tax=Harpegnathos saltator TaxID=610380 RepID=E2BLU2_HARSA|nr:dolichyl pyrophosphate Man9GlcNAc2 alpha-1,3-glucosyltransferase isoform X1 [Harpegnathos saltator]EFN83426.1 Dolichyl pyrophosphate Man9GlcNAc2 alpha-1,3-glucosyltransferase [Harpegnathos saltator]
MQGELKVTLILFCAILLRCCVTFHPHSGEGKPPMYGDYEAQRHWQEIALNLPVNQWYINTTDNDLQYWGLDYPPLTAYHSLLLGHIANTIDPSFVRLHESRGIETVTHKHFMRLTVLIADVLTFIPAVAYFVMKLCLCECSQIKKLNICGKSKLRYFLLMTALIYPGLIMIDHGHFQYNCVSLGLFIAAVAAITRDWFALSSVLFVLALNYKQMELYHALPFFFYTLGSYKGRSWNSHSLMKLMGVSFTVLATFYIIWMPFLQSRDLLVNVVLRLFPFARGVFEDKVANVWCAINVVYKLRKTFTNTTLAKICLVVTTCGVAPSCVHLYRSPGRNAFVVSLINSALAFFLFSFQVHEKSILLAAVPVLLHFHNDPLPCFWFLVISCFSMLPLLIKDGLYLVYILTMAIYFITISWMWPGMFHDDKANDRSSRRESSNSKRRLLARKKEHGFSSYLGYNKKTCFLVTFYLSLSGVLLLSVASKYVKPPERYPDLFPLLVSVYSCGHFLLFFVYFNYAQFTASRGNCGKCVKYE